MIREAIKADQASAEGHLELGKVYAGNNQLAEAEMAFKEALKLDPANPKSAFYLAILTAHRNRDPSQAMNYWEMALEDAARAEDVPLLSVIRQKMALAYHRMGQPEKARECLQDLLTNHGDQLIDRQTPESLLKNLTEESEETDRKLLEKVQADNCWKDSFCVPQSIATVLKYWDHPCDVLELGTALQTDEKGTVPSRIATALEQLKIPFEPTFFTITVDQVRALVKERIPVIILGDMFAPLQGKYHRHASVITGFDNRLELFFLQDANWLSGIESIAYEEIGDLTGLVIAPENQGSFDHSLADSSYHDRVNTGMHHILEGNPHLAISELKEAIASNPDLARGHFNLAAVYQAEQESELAEAEIRRTIALLKDPVPAMMALAKFQQRRKQHSSACETLKKALALKPSFTGARKVLLELLQSLNRDHAEALEHARILHRLAPNDLKALRSLAMAHSRMNQKAKSLPFLRKAVQISGHLGDFTDLAQRLFEVGQLEESRTVCEEALPLCREEEEKGPFHEVLSHIEAATNLHGLIRIAGNQVINGNLEEAEKIFHKAAELNSENPIALICLA
ncbi:MAG: tetratricopeptide repeat protein, partial [Verrucomicrobiota bacterium]